MGAGLFGLAVAAASLLVAPLAQAGQLVPHCKMVRPPVFNILLGKVPNFGTPGCQYTPGGCHQLSYTVTTTIGIPAGTVSVPGRPPQGPEVLPNMSHLYQDTVETPGFGYHEIRMTIPTPSILAFVVCASGNAP
jgi:hypothetical protein